MRQGKKPKLKGEDELQQDTRDTVSLDQMSEQSHLHNFDVTRFGFVNAELVVVYFVAIGGCRKRIYLLSGGVHVRSADAILNFVLGSELCLSHLNGE